MIEFNNNNHTFQKSIVNNNNLSGMNSLFEKTLKNMALPPKITPAEEMYRSKLNKNKRKSDLVNALTEEDDTSLDSVVKDIKKNLKLLVEIEKSVYSDY